MSRLTDRPSKGSFYESFTDLIFSTLVIFIVLIMGMAIQLQSSQGEIEEAAKTTRDEVLELVSQSRFGGGADYTVINVGHLRIDGQAHMMWIPSSLADSFRFAREEGGNDPVLAFCKRALEPDGFCFLSIDEVVGMEGGVNEAFVDWDYGVIEWYAVPRLAYAARQLVAGKPEGWTAERLKSELGGLHADKLGSKPGALAEKAYEEHWHFYEQGPHWKKTTGELERRLAHTIGEPAHIVIESIGPNRARIGKTEVSAADLRNILLSVKPGKGFYIQHIGADGKETAPPAWLYDGILVPLGFDRRLIREEALEIAEGG